MTLHIYNNLIKTIKPMKLNKFLIVALALTLGLGMASCKQQDEPKTQQSEGTTYMSVALSMGQGLRAEGEDFNKKGTWKGTDKIESIDIYMVASNMEIERKTVDFTPGDNDGKDGVAVVPAFKTTPGTKTIYVVLNNSGAIQQKLNSATAADFDDTYKAAYDLLATAKVAGAEDIIMMTGEPKKVDIIDNVTEGAANEATNGENQNRFKMEVRRTVARVSATTPLEGPDYEIKGSIKVNGEEKTMVLGTLKDLKWAPRQYEKTSYLLYKDANNAHTYTDAKLVFSPNYNYGKDGNVTDEESKTRYLYDGAAKDFGKSDAGLTFDNVVAAQKEKTSAFITETTHPYDGGSFYKKGNTAYILVSGTFAPAADLWAAGEQAKADNSDGTIYWGTTKGKFYKDEAKAKADNKPADTTGGKDGVVPFKAGKMYYIAYVNPDTNKPTTWKYAPVVRNNVYNVNVTKFSKLGLYHDPNNPNEPEDPDQPDPDPNDPIKDTETYMAYEITVINWGVHFYDIEF